MRRARYVLCLATLLTGPTWASTPAERDRLADAAFAASEAPGLVVMVVDPAGMHFLARGHQDPSASKPPRADSLVRVNSLSKVMAAELLADAVDAGELQLDTPLARFASGPVPGGATITLGDLATHTAGLPRNLPSADWPEDAAPNTWPDPVARWRWLASLPPPPAPGRRALYSTPGFLFLGDALAASAGRPYVELLAARLTGPLGMHDTTAQPDPAQCARLMRAPSEDPLRYACVDTRNTAASAGMYASAHDIGVWMQAMLARERDGGYPPWRAQRTRAALERIDGLDTAGRADAIGLGWIRLDASATSPLIVQKTAAGGGFSAYLAFAPDIGTGVFVAATHYDAQELPVLAAAVNAWLARAPVSSIDRK